MSRLSLLLEVCQKSDVLETIEGFTSCAMIFRRLCVALRNNIGVESTYLCLARSSTQIQSVLNIKDSRSRNEIMGKALHAAVKAEDEDGVNSLLTHIQVRGNVKLPSKRGGEEFMDIAARSGNLTIVRYLHGAHHQFTSTTMIEATRSSNCKPVLEFLLEKKCTFDKAAVVEASKIGNLEALQFFEDQYDDSDCFSEEVCWVSPLSNKNDVFDHLLEKGNMYNALTSVHTLEMAALSGNLYVAKKIKDMGLAWSDDVAWIAALSNHLDFLKWANAVDPLCKKNDFVLEVARLKSFQDIVRYCEKQIKG